MSMKRSFLYLPLLLLAISFSLFTLHCGADSVGISPNPGISTQGCGSGTIDAGESCDDGNKENSDGCNAHCAWEVGEASCGNGILENEECCDDGNANSGDGCSDTCLSEKNNHPPLAPLLSPNPANGVTWSPTRLYLSWSASTDSDPGDSLVYDVYFAEGAAEGTVPYKKDIRSTHFIIQASTDNRSEYFPDLVRPIYLLPNRTYTWKVCARDSKNASNCSERRVFNTDNSVVGWWRFDENPAGATCPSMPGVGGPAGDPGETVCDYSGFGNHGVPRGGPAWLPPITGPMNPYLGGALQLNGMNNYIIMGDRPSFEAFNSFNIDVLLRTNTTATNKAIASKWFRTSSYQITMGASGTPGQVRFSTRTTSFSEIDSRTLVNDGNLHYISGTYDGTMQKLFIDGNLENMRPQSDVIADSPEEFCIGDFCSGDIGQSGFNFEGIIDEVRIYNSALPTAAILNNYCAIENCDR